VVILLEKLRVLFRNSAVEIHLIKTRRLKPRLHTRSPPARTKITRYQALPGNADPEALPPIFLSLARQS
jgi:hypothetical protein